MSGNLFTFISHYLDSIFLSILFEKYIYMHIDWFINMPGFDSSFEHLVYLAILKSCDTRNSLVCLLKAIYAPSPGCVELSSERITGCHGRNAKLFE